MIAENHRKLKFPFQKFRIQLIRMKKNRNDRNNRFRQLTEEIRILKAKNQELTSLINSMQQTQEESSTSKSVNK